MHGMKAKLYKAMKNYEQDNVGYCLQVTPQGINLIKLLADGLPMSLGESKGIFIKCLVDFDRTDKLSDFTLDVATRQFSDRTIDIFLDDEGILKNLPLVARTESGISLHGNLAIFSSDSNGNTILLTEEQVTTVLQELGFPFHPGISQIDMTDSSNPRVEQEQNSLELKLILESLIKHCVNNGEQLLSRAKAISTVGDDDVLIVCLHGRSEAIKKLYDKIHSLVKSCEFGQYLNN